MARLSTVIIFLFLFLFSFQAQAKSPPPGTGTTDIPANILIMLDKSGSMRDTLVSNTVTQYPIDVAADSSGNVYVLEYANSRIKVFDSAGTYLRSFGGYGSGCNQWKYARKFTIFNDQVYLVDTQGNRVLKLSLTVNVLVVAILITLDHLVLLLIVIMFLSEILAIQLKHLRQVT